MSKQFQTIRTYARIKPIFNQQQKVFFKKDICTIQTKNNDLYGFDRVFDQNTSNQEVYNFSTKQVLQQCFGGFNITVLAYGQTSSGKTHTMKGTKQNRGIIPLCLQDIFKKIQADKIPAQVKVSYIEIYNQNIIDLLSSQDNHIIQIRDDQQQNLVFTSLTQFKVDAIDQAMILFDRGEQRRKFASNNLNMNSSRSHAIFRITIRMCNEEIQYTTSQVNLVDLAGSESLEKTKGQKIAKTQGQNINKSLLALTKVIKSMSQKTQRTWIGYRESKLTRILKKSLCENSFSSIICMINPIQTNYQQSINTLKFGQMAAKIKIQTRRNLIQTQESKKQIKHQTFQMLPSQKIQLYELKQKMMSYQAQLIQLKNRCIQLSQQNYSKDNYIAINQTKIQTLNEQLQMNKMKYQKRHQELWNQNQNLKTKVDQYRSQMDALQKMNTQLRSQKRTLQRNQKTLAESIQHINNQCRHLTEELNSLRNKIDEESSKKSKISAFKDIRNPIKKNQKQKPNPFQLQPYKQNTDRLSSSQLTWIVKLKINVIELNRKVNQYIKANAQIAEQNEQMRRRLEQYEQQDENKRKSSKINPQALEYKEIKKLQNKLKKAKTQLKTSQQRQKKYRQILKTQSCGNLNQVQEFEQFFMKKHDPNFCKNRQIQTDFSQLPNILFSNSFNKNRIKNQEQIQKMQIQQNNFIDPIIISPIYQNGNNQNNNFILNTNPAIRSQNPEQIRNSSSKKMKLFQSCQKQIQNQNKDLNINNQVYSNNLSIPSRDSCNESQLLDNLSPDLCVYGNGSRNFLNMDQSRGSKKNSRTNKKQNVPANNVFNQRIADFFQSSSQNNRNSNQQQRDFQI